MNFLSTENIFITIAGYPMSFIEFFGTLFNLAGVWLMTQNKILTWPIGIMGVILFAFLFFQIQLYVDCAEQFYYLGSSLYGWWVWNKKTQSPEQKDELSFSSFSSICVCALFCFLFTFPLSFLDAHLHEYWPQIFVEPASYPFIDSLTTVMSFASMILMAHKRIENWIYWIIVDTISVWLYAVKGTLFVSCLYFIYLLLAIYGLKKWLKLQRESISKPA